jgi:hypothetical protein
MLMDDDPSLGRNPDQPPRELGRLKGGDAGFEDPAQMQMGSGALLNFFVRHDLKGMQAMGIQYVDGGAPCIELQEDAPAA